MKRLYSEGSTFLVPLPAGGFARGVIARASLRRGILFGYFFAPRLPALEDADFNRLQAREAILSIRFGDMGLKQKAWPIFGIMSDWIRSEWPMKDAVIRDALGMIRPILVQYSDDDPCKVVRQTYLDHDPGLPSDGMAGHGYVELRLDRLLSDKAQP